MLSAHTTRGCGIPCAISFLHDDVRGPQVYKLNHNFNVREECALKKLQDLLKSK